MSDELLEELVRRDLAERSLQHDDPVIQRALKIIGQPLNPIKVIDQKGVESIYRESAPEQVDHFWGRRRLWGVAGFRRPNDDQDPNIYINRDHERYGNAKRGSDALAQLKLAGTLLHEQIHNSEGGVVGERAARRKESDFFRSRIDALPKWQRREALEWLKILDIESANDPGNVKK